MEENKIISCTDKSVIWYYSNQTGVTFSPSFLIGDIPCHLFCTESSLYIRSLGRHMRCLNLSGGIVPRVAPHGTSFGTSSISNELSFKHKDFVLGTEPFQLCASDILGCGLSFTIELQYRIEPIARSDVASAFSPSSYIAGLTNQGATCYINVVLQVLFALPYFRSQLLHADTQQSLLQEELKRLFHAMLLNTYALQDALYSEGVATRPEDVPRVVDTRGIISVLGALFPDVNSQGDAQEFFLALLEHLLETPLRESIHHLFLIKGEHVLSVQQECPSSATKYSQLMQPHKRIPQQDFFLSLPITFAGTLRAGLASVFATEILDTDEGSCTTSAYRITELPNVLVLSFQRVLYNSRTANIEKDATPVALEREIDLADIMSCTAQDDAGYTFFAAITHCGTGQHGHYILYVVHYLVSNKSTNVEDLNVVEDSGGIMLTDDLLIGPACSSLSSEPILFRISDAHVSEVSMESILSTAHQKHETIYMLFYLRNSAYESICRSSSYCISDAYKQHVKAMRDIITMSSMLPYRQKVKVHVATKASVHISVSGVLKIAHLKAYSIPKLAGLEFILSLDEFGLSSKQSIFPLSVENDVIGSIGRPLNMARDVNVPIVDMVRRVDLDQRDNDELVWYVSDYKAQPSSIPYFLIAYITDTDSAFLSHVLKGMNNALAGSLPVDQLTNRNSDSPCVFLGEQFMSSGSCSASEVLRTCKVCLARYVLATLLSYPSPPDLLVNRLAQQLNPLVYYNRQGTHDFLQLVHQDLPSEPGILYLGIALDNYEGKNTPATSLSQSSICPLKDFIAHLARRIAIVFEPIDFAAVNLGSTAFKFAGLFLDSIPTSLLVDISPYLQKAKPYCNNHYTPVFTELEALPSMRRQVSVDDTLESLSHQIYQELSKIDMIKFMSIDASVCECTITLGDILQFLQNTFPQCLQGEQLMLYNCKSDAYIAEKSLNPPDEHVALYNDSINNSSGANGSDSATASVNGQTLSTSSVVLSHQRQELEPMPFFTRNNSLYGTLQNFAAEAEHRQLVTVQDVFPCRSTAIPSTRSYGNLFSPVSLRRIPQFGKNIYAINVSTAAPETKTRRTLTLKYAVPRVFFRYLVMVRPVRVLLVIHNLPILDLVFLISREPNRQYLSIVSKQIDNFLSVLFKTINIKLENIILSLSNINGCTTSLLTNHNELLSTVRGQPTNPDSILRCDVCTGMPNVLVRYKPPCCGSTGIDQLLCATSTSGTINPDTILAELQASHDRALDFIRACKECDEALVILRGHSPEARILWTTEQLYQDLQKDIVTAGRSITEESAATALKPIAESFERSNIVMELSMWSCKVDHQFTGSVPSDNKLLQAYLDAKK